MKYGVACVILGGGGHAQVLLDTMQTSGIDMNIAILDPDPALWGKELLGVPVIGGDELLPALAECGATHFVVGLGSTGDSLPRQRLFELGLSLGLKPLTIMHHTAVLSRWAEVGEGCQLLVRSIVNTGAMIGTNVIVNSGAIVEHHCVVDDHAHIATGALLASTVHVGVGAHIGAGATVRQGTVIGQGAIVGAGAVVVKDVPPFTVVVGVPARPVREAEASVHTNNTPSGH